MNKQSYYIEKIKYYSKLEKTYMNQKKYMPYIKEHIDSLINNNLDYLLTESYLDYLVYDGVASIRLYKLSDNIELRIEALVSYYQHIINVYKNRDSKYYPNYVKLLDNDTKEATIKANNRIGYLYENYNRYQYRLYDVEKIIYIVLAYCHINKCMNDFDAICNIFIKNPYNTLEDLYLNDIRDPIGVSIHENDEILIDRVLSIINSNEKKKIK